MREFLAANSTGSLGKPYSARPARWPVPPIQPRAFSCRRFRCFEVFRFHHTWDLSGLRHLAAIGQQPVSHFRIAVFHRPADRFQRTRGQRVERSAATFQVFPKPRGIIPEYLGDGAKIPVLLAGNRRHRLTDEVAMQDAFLQCWRNVRAGSAFSDGYRCRLGHITGSDACCCDRGNYRRDSATLLPRCQSNPSGRPAAANSR